MGALSKQESYFISRFTYFQFFLHNAPHFLLIWHFLHENLVEIWQWQYLISYYNTNRLKAADGGFDEKSDQTDKE